MVSWARVAFAVIFLWFSPSISLSLCVRSVHVHPFGRLSNRSKPVFCLHENEISIDFDEFHYCSCVVVYVSKVFEILYNLCWTLDFNKYSTKNHQSLLFLLEVSIHQHWPNHSIKIVQQNEVTKTKKKTVSFAVFITYERRVEREWFSIFWLLVSWRTWNEEPLLKCFTFDGASIDNWMFERWRGYGSTPKRSIRIRWGMWNLIFRFCIALRSSPYAISKALMLCMGWFNAAVRMHAQMERRGETVS